MYLKMTVSGSNKNFVGESLDHHTASLAFVVFAINLLLIYKGLRQLQSTSNRRYQKATLIIGYLKLISQKWREQIMAERRYLFALVPILDDDDLKAASDSAQHS